MGLSGRQLRVVSSRMAHLAVPTKVSGSLHLIFVCVPRKIVSIKTEPIPLNLIGTRYRMLNYIFPLIPKGGRCGITYHIKKYIHTIFLAIKNDRCYNLPVIKKRQKKRLPLSAVFL